MFVNNSLKTRLIVLLVLFALIPACISGIVGGYINSQSIKESTIHANLNTAQQIGNEITRMVEDARSVTEMLAATPTAKSMDPAAMKELILAAQQKNSIFELIFVMDATGMQIARTSGNLANRSDRPYFKEAIKGNNFFTDVYISSFTNAPCITIASPIKNSSGQIVGVMAADVSLKAIWGIVDQVHIGQTGYVDVVDNKGTVIAHPDKERVLKKESFATYDYIAQAIDSQHGSMEAISTRGEKSLVVYSSIARNKWGVIVYEPIGEVMAAVMHAALVTGVITLLAVLIALISAYYVARSIVRPLEKLVIAAEQVADGDLAHTIEVRGVAEINKLTDAFNIMISSLRSLVAKTSATAETVAASSEELAASSGEVGKAAEEVAITIQSVAEGATSQVNLADNSAQVIRDMVEAIANTSKAAHSVAAASEQSERAAEAGSDQIGKAVTKMNEIEQDVNRATKMIHALGDKSRQIGQIVDVITGIAGQTNLLALNAAIEAARAGEQGRGFAVVADEVRKLAEQSESAAREIAGIIQAIQSETVETVNAIDKGGREVAAGVQVVESSGAAFKEIYAAIKNVRDEVIRIVALTEEQQRRSGQVEEAVHSIADSARLNAASAEQVAAASQQQNASVQEITAASSGLAHMAAELQQAVLKFKI
ncbi:methyl-accepting chemotaxis protein [Sporomusa sp.]|uniref:methyl-accepting chemotaxis protein n=1 Tax=Sporomusa sp. TaxID=2078658 RepID=UPI002BF13058|nr:methyl-accepting chemotaxis protein [Sporomusa sp.]HWR45458.1 methyl-accepting chemotaxis protein [Sporomusa sp.]